MRTRRTTENFVRSNKNFSTKDECFCQAEAMLKAANGDKELAERAMMLYAREMREIIESFETVYNRVPSGDDILWILSERRHKDLREVFAEYGKKHRCPYSRRHCKMDKPCSGCDVYDTWVNRWKAKKC